MAKVTEFILSDDYIPITVLLLRVGPVVSSM